MSDRVYLESEILVHLLTAKRPEDRTTPAIAKATGRSYSAVRSYLHLFRRGRTPAWTTAIRGHQHPWEIGVVHTLTVKGREVARYRRSTLRRDRAIPPASDRGGT